MANLPPTSALGPPPSTKRPRIDLDPGEEVQLIRFWGKMSGQSILCLMVPSIGMSGYRISKKREPKGFVQCLTPTFAVQYSFLSYLSGAFGSISGL